LKTLLDPTFWKRLPIPVVGDVLAGISAHGLYRGDALRE
jgi:hypothetical protein